MEPLRLIVNAVVVPDGAKVSKVGGKSKYTLRDAVSVHHDNGPPQIIKSDDVRYLIGDNGSITAVSIHRDLCWFATSDDVMRLIRPDDSK